MSEHRPAIIEPEEQNLQAARQIKPSLVEWLETFVPFHFPRIPFPQAAKNLDKSAARLMTAGTNNIASRIDASTLHNRAISRAKIEYIDLGVSRIVGDGADLQSDLAMEYVLNEAKLSNNNRQKVLEVAAQDLERRPIEDDASGSISDDWLNIFSRLASDKSDADIQHLWGKILSGEIRQPGKVKLRTLSALSQFDKADADFAHYFLAHAVDNSWIYNGYFSEKKIYAQIVQAMELGLVNTSAYIDYNKEDSTSTISVCNGARLLISFEGKESFSFGLISTLTALGQTLCEFLETPVVEKRYIDLLVERYGEEEGVHAEVLAWGRQTASVALPYGRDSGIP